MILNPDPTGFLIRTRILIRNRASNHLNYRLETEAFFLIMILIVIQLFLLYGIFYFITVPVINLLPFASLFAFIWMQLWTRRENITRLDFNSGEQREKWGKKGIWWIFPPPLSFLVLFPLLFSSFWKIFDSSIPSLLFFRNLRFSSSPSVHSFPSFLSFPLLLTSSSMKLLKCIILT